MILSFNVLMYTLLTWTINSKSQLVSQLNALTISTLQQIYREMGFSGLGVIQFAGDGGGKIMFLLFVIVN